MTPKCWTVPDWEDSVLETVKIYMGRMQVPRPHDPDILRLENPPWRGIAERSWRWWKAVLKEQTAIEKDRDWWRDGESTGKSEKWIEMNKLRQLGW